MDSWNACIRPQNVQHYRMVAHRRTCTHEARYRYFSKLVTSSLVQYSKTSPTWLQLQLGAIYLGQYFWLGIQSACTKKWLAWGKRGGLRLRLTVLIPLPLFPSITGVFSLVFSFAVDVCSCFLYKSAVKRLWCPGCTKARIYKRISNLRWWNDGLRACSNNPRRQVLMSQSWPCRRVFRKMPLFATSPLSFPQKKTTMFKMIALFTLFCALAASANAANCRCSWTPEK